jgi:hypothetical protein
MQEIENEQGQEKTQSSSNEPIFKRFKEERDEWTSRIKSMSERLKDIYHLADLQTDLYSYRQIAVDYTHTLMTHLTKINKIFRERKVERWEHYTRNYDLRMDKDPKEYHIFVDIADVVERREYVQTHLEFFRETIKTIDTMCYGIKHRMALEEYKRG